jgi:hypothetical protein
MGLFNPDYGADSLEDLSDPHPVNPRGDEISTALSEGAQAHAIERLGEVARSMETLEWQFLRKNKHRDDLAPSD